ncbi:hypothetical protein Dimus_035822 [Dionaea muscipula]
MLKIQGDGAEHDGDWVSKTPVNHGVRCWMDKSFCMDVVHGVQGYEDKFQHWIMYGLCMAMDSMGSGRTALGSCSTEVIATAISVTP